MPLNICKYVPTPKLLALGVTTSILSLFHTGYQYAVTGLPSDVLKQFIRESQAWQTGKSDPSLVSDSWVNLVWGVVIAGLPLSTFIGCLLAPTLADNLGRKPVLFLINNVIVIVGSMFVLISSWTMLWEMLLLGRICFGIQIGIAVSVVPSYLTECSPTKYRGFMGSLHGPCTYLGALIAAVLSLKSIMGTPTLWPILLAAGAVPALIQITLYCLVPETPQYSYIQNKDGSAALATIKGYFGAEDSTPEIIEATLKEYHNQKQSSGDVLGILQVLKTRILRPTILLVLVIGMARSATGEYTLMMYTTDILTSSGVSPSFVETIGICMQVSVVLAGSIGCILVESVGRRWLMLVTLSYCAVCWLIVLVMHSVDSYTTGGAVWAVWVSVSIMLSIYGLAYPCGCSTISWFISAELASQPERTSISSLCMMADSLMAFTITLLYPVVSAWNYPTAIIMFFIIPLSIIVFLLYRRLPETKNRPILEIVAEIRSRAGTERTTTELERLLSQSSSDSASRGESVELGRPWGSEKIGNRSTYGS